MRRIIPWSHTRVENDSVIANPLGITDERGSGEVPEQPQEPAIVCRVVEVQSPSEDNGPSSRFPLDNLRTGVVLKGPHRGIPGFSLGSSTRVEQVLLKRPCTKYRAVDREGAVWRAMPSHPHILQFLGACKVTRQWYYAIPHLQLSPMLVYLPTSPNADRGGLVLQVCDALRALHSFNIVHGQVGITNILVSEHRAILYDFCQSRIQAEGFEEDVFDFGVTIAEILRGKQYNHRIFRLLRTHPRRPAWASPERVSYGPVWEVAAWCWRPAPASRPVISEIFEALSKSLVQMRRNDPPAAGLDAFPLQDLGTPPHSEPPPRPQARPISSSSVIRPRSAPSTPSLGGATLQQESNGQWTDCITFPGLPPLRYRRLKGTPHAFGGFSDVWMCETTYSDNSRQLVAEKVLRVTRSDETELKLRKRLAQEIIIWRDLIHPCIAPLMGFTLQPSIALISPWYPNGNVQKYIKSNPDCDRLKLLHEVARGLTYLHEFSPPVRVVHGDIKPDNILIDDDGSAVITDFGLSRSVAEIIPESISSNRGAGNRRWMAPELVDGKLPKSLKGDVYSFASLALKILTGAIPFKHLTNEYAIILTLHKGDPPAPESTRGKMSCNTTLERPIWALLDECWTTEPAVRPRMRRVEGRILELRLQEAIITDCRSSHISHPPPSIERNKDEKCEEKGCVQETVLPRDAVDEISGEKLPPVVLLSSKPACIPAPETLIQQARRNLFNLTRLGRRPTNLSSQP